MLSDGTKIFIKTALFTVMSDIKLNPFFNQGFHFFSSFFNLHSLCICAVFCVGYSGCWFTPLRLKVNTLSAGKIYTVGTRRGEKKHLIKVI